MSQSTATLSEALSWARSELERSDVFFGQGTDNAADEAAWLVLHAAGLRPDRPIEDADMPLQPEQWRAAQDLVWRRIRDKQPAAYLTRRAWFAGIEFFVDERVLIPRSPLAEPIATGFAPWLQPERVEAVLDLCTGSGCIALACAAAFPSARIDASDISPAALEVAAINVARQHARTRVRLLESDLFDHLPRRRYQLIISNPPYVGDAEMADLPAEFHHEPAEALRADDDGLALVSRILMDAADYLDPAGILVVEVGNTEELVEACYPDLGLQWLEFEQGGSGVFLVAAKDLARWADEQRYE